jgi:hypothetical protein
MKAKKTKRLCVLLSEEEFKKIKEHFSLSTSQSMSEYIRKKTLDLPVTIKYRNTSLDDYVSEMIRLRSELHAIANDFDPALKKLSANIQDPEIKSYVQKMEKGQEAISQTVAIINERMIAIFEIWSHTYGEAKT